MLSASRLLVCCLILISNAGTALADAAQEYTVKAAIALNFARFTTWPETDKPFVTLCVLGNSVVEGAFLQVDNKQVGEKQLQVAYLSRPRNLGHCQVLYVSGLDRNITIQILNEIKHQPILSIGEQDYFTDYGGMVNLTMQNEKININVNVDATKQTGLTISSRVLKLATIVKSK